MKKTLNYIVFSLMDTSIVVGIIIFTFVYQIQLFIGEYSIPIYEKVPAEQFVGKQFWVTKETHKEQQPESENYLLGNEGYLTSHHRETVDIDNNLTFFGKENILGTVPFFLAGKMNNHFVVDTTSDFIEHIHPYYQPAIKSVSYMVGSNVTLPKSDSFYSMPESGNYTDNLIFRINNELQNAHTLLLIIDRKASFEDEEDSSPYRMLSTRTAEPRKTSKEVRKPSEEKTVDSIGGITGQMKFIGYSMMIYWGILGVLLMGLIIYGLNYPKMVKKGIAKGKSKEEVLDSARPYATILLNNNHEYKLVRFLRIFLIGLALLVLAILIIKPDLLFLVLGGGKESTDDISNYNQIMGRINPLVLVTYVGFLITIYVPHVILCYLAPKRISNLYDKHVAHIKQIAEKL